MKQRLIILAVILRLITLVTASQALAVSAKNIYVGVKKSLAMLEDIVGGKEILKKAKGTEEIKDKYELHDSEKELIKELTKWPELISEVSKTYEVHKVAFYAISIADKLHGFYENCKVVEDDKVLEFRLEIVKATKEVLQNVLKCLGVNTPEQM